MSVCHFEDENTSDSLACRLGTSNCEVIVFKCRPLLLAFVVCKLICGRFPCFGKNLKSLPSQISCKVSYLCFKIDLSCCFRLVFFLSFRKLTILACLVCSLLFHPGDVADMSGIDTGVVYSRKPTYLDSACV